MKAKPGARKGSVVLEMDRSDDKLIRSALRVPFVIQSILVPVDFSECSIKALRYAVAFAEQHEASITLLYVIPPPTYAYGEYGEILYAVNPREMRRNALQSLAQIRADEVPAHLRCRTRVKLGAPGQAIPELAKRLATDLIIISTHGYSGFKHVLMGSVAEHVVRYAPCPVLVVREHEHEFLKS